MAQQTINIGAAANDGTGDPARTAFGKVNDNFTELYAQSGHGVIGSTVTTKQDDYAPDGWSACRTLRWNGAGSTGITGFDSTDIPDGAERIITNASTDYLLWLENENTASSAANRMALPKGFPAFLMPGDSLTLQYDTTAARWRVIDWPNQGAAVGFTEWADFAGYSTTSAAWIGGATSGTGASVEPGNSLVTATGKAAGTLRLKTGTTTTGYAQIGAYPGNILRANLSSALIGASLSSESVVDGTETFSIECGFLKGAGTNDQAVCWEYYWNGSSPELAQKLVVGGSVTRSTTNSPSLSEFQTVPLQLLVFLTSSAADMIYSANGTSFNVAQRFSSGLPTNAVGAGVRILKSAGTTNRTAAVDWAGCRINQVRS